MKDFRTPRKFNKRNKNAKAILQDEQKHCANVGLDVPTYFTINAPPSLRPKKHWCDITGLPAPYHSKNGLRFHNRQVYEIVQSLGPGVDQEYLKVRNANLVLR